MNARLNEGNILRAVYLIGGQSSLIGAKSGFSSPTSRPCLIRR